MDKLKETTSLFSKLLTEFNELPELIEEATLLKYEGQHIILVDELIQPNSELYKSLGYSFGTKFGSKVTPQAQRDILDLINDSSIKIYWPYVDDNQDLNSITLTYNPIDNEFENEGLRFEKFNNGYVFKDTVLVNEDYAILYPVWIFDNHEYLEESDAASRKYTAFNIASGTNFFAGIDEPEDDGNTFPSDPNQINFQCCSSIRLNGSHQVNKIYLRHVRVMRNFRGLFGGENQVRVKTSPSNNSASTTNAVNSNSTYISRFRATNQLWTEVNVVVDQNWEINQVEKLFVFESIKTTSDVEKTFDFGIKYAPKLKIDEKGLTLELGPQFNASVKFKVTRTDEISEMIYSRHQFFFENWSNADSRGTYNGNAVRLHKFDRKNGEVFYTYGVVGYNYPD
ncbi:MAG: hypothetical protein ACXIUD_12275 [Mongoliitalea sp.]